MMSQDELMALDARLLAVADRAMTYRPEYGRELQALVNDAREHLSSGRLSLASANGLVAAVEARAVTLALLEAAAGGAAAGGSAPRPSGSRPSGSRPSGSASGSASGTDVAAVAPARQVALAAAPAPSLASWWASLSPVARVGVVVVVGGGVWWAWHRLRGGADG